MWLVGGETMLVVVVSEVLDELSWKNFRPSREWRMLAGRPPMVLTSGGDAAPLS